MHISHKINARSAILGRMQTVLRYRSVYPHIMEEGDAEELSKTFADSVTDTLVKAVLRNFSVFGSAVSFEDPKGDIDLWKVIRRQRKPLKEEEILIAYQGQNVKKISMHLVSPYLKPYWGWFPQEGARSDPFQPFAWALLCSGSAKGSDDRTLVRKLKKSVTEIEVGLHYLAICASFLDLHVPPMEVKSFNYQIERGEFGEAAKSLFRVFGDLLPRALWILKTLEFPDGKVVEDLYDETGVHTLERWPVILIDYRVFPLDEVEITALGDEARQDFEGLLTALENEGVGLELCRGVCKKVYEKMVETSST